MHSPAKGDKPSPGQRILEDQLSTLKNMAISRTFKIQTEIIYVICILFPGCQNTAFASFGRGGRGLISDSY